MNGTSSSSAGRIFGSIDKAPCDRHARTAREVSKHRRRCYCCGAAMSVNRKADVAIVGAGILGLAHAYFAAKRGHKVVVFERTLQAQGASVRKFGMIWPIGQRAGVVHQMAARSRHIWTEIFEASKLEYRPTV